MALAMQSTSGVEEAAQPKQTMANGSGSSRSETSLQSLTLEGDGPTGAAKQKVLFYDPDELKTAPGEPPLPKKVYDEHGEEVDMAGKEALLVKPHPPIPLEDGDHETKVDSEEGETKVRNFVFLWSFQLLGWHNISFSFPKNVSSNIIFHI